MSASQMYLIKMVLKGFGLNPEAIETKAMDVQKIVLEFDLNELKAGMQTILDYKRDQAQNEMRLVAIMNHLGMVDPILLQQVVISDASDAATEEEKTNG